MARTTKRGRTLERLREVRTGRCLTQEQLAEQSGVSQDTIGRAEGGLTISYINITKLATALGVPLDALWRVSPMMTAGTTKDAVALAAKAHTDLDTFATIISVLEGGHLYLPESNQAAQRIISICKAETAKRLRQYDQYVAQARRP